MIEEKLDRIEKLLLMNYNRCPSAYLWHESRKELAKLKEELILDYNTVQHRIRMLEMKKQ